MSHADEDQSRDGTPVPRMMRNPPRVLKPSEAIRRMGGPDRGKPCDKREWVVVDRRGEWDQRGERWDGAGTPPE